MMNHEDAVKGTKVVVSFDDKLGISHDIEGTLTGNIKPYHDVFVYEVNLGGTARAYWFAREITITTNNAS